MVLAENVIYVDKLVCTLVQSVKEEENNCGTRLDVTAQKRRKKDV